MKLGQPLTGIVHRWRQPVGEKLAERSEPDLNTGCLLWSASVNKTGYGVFGPGHLAHRAAYAVTNGPIPPGLCVLHRCDTPACINPDHLFLGTLADNSADMVRKGRARGGLARAKLSPDDVRLIRSSDAPARDLAQRFGCGAAAIRHVRDGTSWSHVK